MTGGIGTTYGRATYDQQGMLATWLPDRSLRVGDIVSRSKRTGALTVQTTLDEVVSKDQELPRTVTSKGPERLAFQSGATIDLGSSGTISGAGRAEVRFSGKSSFIFAAVSGHPGVAAGGDPLLAGDHRQLQQQVQISCSPLVIRCTVIGMKPGLQAADKRPTRMSRRNDAGH